jgi:hypothetical protein
VAIANLALRFITELAGIVALGYVGFQISDSTTIRVIATVGFPLLVILGWAVVAAPNAANGLSQAQKDVIGTLLLLLAALALGLAGQARLAIALGVVVLANTTLLFALGDDARTSLGGMSR